MDDELDSPEFAEAYKTALLRAARVAKQNQQDCTLAEDAAQEAVLNLLRRKKTSKVTNWLAFLHTSVRRELVKLIRKSQQGVEANAGHATPSANHSTEQIYTSILVSELQARLSEKEIEIVWQYEFHGLSWKEISVRQGLSIEATRKRYYRSLSKIRETLALDTTKEPPKDRR